MNPASSSVRAFRPLLAHAASPARSSTTPRIATFATSSYLRRPPQPTAPVREAAEPAVVKSPSQPPNPASWPGRQKESSPTSQSAWQGQQSGPTPAAPQAESIPHAESSKAAQERAAKLSTEGRAQQQQPSKIQSGSAGQSASTSASEGSCATLSPSSPAGPRSQTAVAQGKAKESSTPKAAPPEEAPAKGAAAALPSPPSTSAAKPATSGKAFRAKKAALSLTPTAVERLNELLESDSGPRLIRIGVRNKGCAGMSYHLEYVTPDQAGKFDERVKQDGVEVLIDSKALFSIIGSEMDWQEDKLSAKFVFNNPNVKESCGCGESFLT